MAGIRIGPYFQSPSIWKGVGFGDVRPHLRTKTTPWLPNEVTIDALSQFDAIYLRNKFHFSKVHGTQRITCKVSDDLNFARDPLRSYFHEPQKNEIHLLYLHFIFTSFLFIICGILV